MHAAFASIVDLTVHGALHNAVGRGTVSSFFLEWVIQGHWRI